MKRIKAACIQQTLVFFQKPEAGFSVEEALKMNRDEYARYKNQLERTRTRYVIVSEEENADGSIVVRVKKQYNEKADVAEYFA